MHYLFKMNNMDLLKMSKTKSSSVTKHNAFGKYIVKTDNKEIFRSNLNIVRDDIAFIDELMCDYLESVKDVTKVSEEQVNEFFDKSEQAISKIDTLKNIILHLNEIFEQEKLYDINRKDLVSFLGDKTDNPVLEIPNGVERICSKAFNCVEGAVKIILPDSVKIIEDDAFYKCRTLIQVIVPYSFRHLDGKQVEFCRMAKYYLKK